LYDEFGNYVGPDLDSDDESAEAHAQEAPDDASEVSTDRHLMERSNDDDAMDTDEPLADPVGQIVLHEDKEYYAEASSVYGADVRTAVLDEDAQQELDQALIIDKMQTQSLYGVLDKKLMPIQSSDDWLYTDDYLGVHLSNATTRNRRAIALVGDFHHGKTCLVDLLLQSGALSKSLAHRLPAATKLTDTLATERARQMSLVSTPLVTLLPDTRGKSYALSLLDCPGHVQFHEESVVALRAADGAVLCVDALEGPGGMHTQVLVQQIVAEGLPITLVLTKVDRLICELHLPPRDAYFKLLHSIERLNQMIQQVSHGRYPPLAPQRGNVAFSSAAHGWLFTLESFASVYLEHNESLTADSSTEALTVPDLAARLWGDAYLDPNTRTFHTSARDCATPGVERTFCALVLSPLYKIYAACLGEAPSDVNALLRSVGVLLRKDELRQDTKPLLRTALAKFLQSSTAGFMEMIVHHVPCPAVAAAAKVKRNYTGPLDTNNSKVAAALLACDPDGPLIMHAVKLYPMAANPSNGGDDDDEKGTADAVASSFWTLCRIYSGTVRPAATVHVLGEAYQPGLDEEDATTATIEALAVPRIGTRLVTQVDRVGAGNWVLVQGIDATIAKTATLVGTFGMEDVSVDPVHIFKPLSFPYVGGQAVVKLAMEPLQPAELPKMVEGLRRVSKAYPMVRTKVEESGEHVLWGTGELYLDCVLHDLRKVYSDMEIKVADPIVSFRETVIETSSVKCFAETANKRNKLTFLAEPLDDGLAEKLEWGKVHPDWDKRKVGRFFQSQYQWDLLASRSIWAFGDSATHGTNILLDDTLPSEVDKKLLNTCKSSIVQGFQWATREGPLCDEPVRATKLKLLDVMLADKPIHRGGGQMIPTARRVVHAALLTATPRLMEPIYRLHIQCPQPIVEAIQPLLRRRRGHIVQDRPIPGTTLYTVKGYLPVLDSFGFETDLRTFTQGQAMVYSVMDHWAVAPGDPLDKNIILHPLEPSPPEFLARELLLKTRRRKGLAEDVSLNKFLDAGLRAQLASGEAGASSLLQ
jgi:U5 small nuclear ribonucleoprotein component